MKATRWSKISTVVVGISVVLLVATLTLPGYDTFETFQATVPSSMGTASSYLIYGYRVPPVSSGSTFQMTITGYKPLNQSLEYGLQFSLTPVIGEKTLPAILGPVSINNESAHSYTAEAQESYSLELEVIAYNGTGFTIAYSGTWSPFDFLPVYTAPAVFLILASLAAAYYFRTQIPKQRNEEEVEAELREERRKAEDVST